jgi:hypothetical protein
MKTVRTVKITPKQYHVIDWDKVNTVEDIKEILKELSMTVDITVCGEKLKTYLIPKVNPYDTAIRTGQAED